MNKKRFLIYSWEGKKYGIHLDEVLEVLEIDKMVKTNLEELKITQYGGRNLPVIDPIAIFSISETQLTRESKIVVMEKRNTKFGFLVDRMYGVEEVAQEDTEVAGVNEKRFIVRTTENFKIADMEKFLDERMMKQITSAYQIRVDMVNSGEKAYQKHVGEREQLVNDLKMRTVNFLIEGNRKKIDESYLKEMTAIQRMVENL